MTRPSSQQLPIATPDADRSLQAPTSGGALAAPTSASAADAGGLEIQWRRYLAAVLRYKWLVLVCAALGGGGGALAPRFVKPTFVAEATILVPQPARTGAPRPIQTEALFQSVGWLELIKTSYIVLDNVVRDLKLYIEPADAADSTLLANMIVKEQFRPGTYELLVRTGGRFELRTTVDEVVQSGMLGTDSVGTPAGFSWMPPADSLTPGERIRFTLVPPRDVARKLQKNVVAHLSERGANMLSVRLEGNNPVRLVATVNEIATGFVDSARSLSQSKHRELTSALRLQLDSAERNLRESEIAFEQFRVVTYTLPRERAAPLAPGVTGTSDPALDRYQTMRFELDDLERDREALEGALAGADSNGIAADAIANVATVQKSSELTAILSDLTEREAALVDLRRRYTDSNPEVRRAAAEVATLRRRRIPDAVRALLAQIAVRERELEDRSRAAGQVLQQIPVRATEEQRLRRQVDLAAARYQELERQYQDAVYAQAAEEVGARVLDAAVVPTRPIKDMALMLLGGGFVGGLGLGILAALVLDQLDRRIRYPDQVSRDLGLPIIGAVPRIRRGRGGRVGEAAQTAQVVEALRGIRLGLQHAHGVAGPLMATVSSPGPGEGKSLVVSNLALAFADAGHRTLLIDGDVRRGDLHRLLEAQRKPGLIDFLQGGLQRESLVQKTRFSSLWFVGGGTRVHTAPELLSSPALVQLLLSLRSSFDVILVDSPPLGAGVDPFVLAAATGNLLLVVRTGVTDRELAGAKLDMLERLPVRILGAILNDVTPGGGYRYYGYHYYLDGYETQQEEVATANDAKDLPATIRSR